MLKKFFKAKIKLILIAIVAALLFFAMVYQVVNKKTVTSSGKIARGVTSSNSGQMAEIVEIDEDKRELKINDEELKDRMDQYLTNSKITKFDIGITDLNDKALYEAFLKAEVESSYPDLRKRSPLSGENGAAGATGGGTFENYAGTNGLAPVYEGNTMGEQIVNYALQFVGGKYVYGGSDLSSGVDCSGFTMRIYEKFGISLPHSSGDQQKYGTPVASLSAAQPGDLICYGGHVAIYIGNNQIVHASNSKAYPAGGIKVGNNANYRSIVTIRRLTTDGKTTEDPDSPVTDPSIPATPTTTVQSGVGDSYFDSIHGYLGDPIDYDSKYVQGKVLFYRRYNNGTGQYLEYKKYEDYMTALAEAGYYLEDAAEGSVDTSNLNMVTPDNLADNTDLHDTLTNVTDDEIVEGVIPSTDKSDADKSMYDTVNAKVKGIPQTISHEDESAMVQHYNNNLKSYFTLDKDHNLIITSMSYNIKTVRYSEYAELDDKVSGEGNSYEANYDIKKINYKDLVLKYAYPFELSMSLLMTTHNAEFCMACCELVNDTKFVVEIQDNTTTTVVTEDECFHAKWKFSRHIEYDHDVMQTQADGSSALVTVHVDLPKEDEQEYDILRDEPYRSTSTTNVEDVVSVHMVFARTWYETLYTEYKNTVNVTASDEEIPYLEYSYKDWTYYSTPRIKKFRAMLGCEFPDDAYNRVDYQPGRDLLKCEEWRTDGKKYINTTITSNNYSVVRMRNNLHPEKSLSKVSYDPDYSDPDNNLYTYNLGDIEKNISDVIYETGGLDPDRQSPLSMFKGYWDGCLDLLKSSGKTVDTAEKFKFLRKVYEGTASVIPVNDDFDYTEVGLIEGANATDNTVAPGINFDGVGDIVYENSDLVDQLNDTSQLEYLLGILNGEVGAGSVEEISHVACVIFNRVVSTYFPNNVMDVLTAPGQFAASPKYDFRTNEALKNKLMAGVNLALQGDTTGGAIFYNKADPSHSANKSLQWTGKRDDFTRMNLGYHYFYKKGDGTNGITADYTANNIVLDNTGSAISSEYKSGTGSGGGSGKITYGEDTVTENGVTLTYQGTYEDEKGRIYKNFKQFQFDGVKDNDDEAWFAKSGCGITSVGIITEQINPSWTPQHWYFYEHGRKVDYFKDSCPHLPQYLKDAGLTYKVVTGSGETGIKEVENALAAGKKVVFCITGNWTLNGDKWAGESGHYIAMLGVKYEGGVPWVYISNPGRNSSRGFNGWFELYRFQTGMYSAHTYLIDVP